MPRIGNPTAVEQYLESKSREVANTAVNAPQMQQQQQQLLASQQQTTPVPPSSMNMNRPAINSNVGVGVAPSMTIPATAPANMMPYQRPRQGNLLATPANQPPATAFLSQPKPQSKVPAYM